jgi:hypothetical protein
MDGALGGEGLLSILFFRLGTIPCVRIRRPLSRCRLPKEEHLVLTNQHRGTKERSLRVERSSFTIA